MSSADDVDAAFFDSFYNFLLLFCRIGIFKNFLVVFIIEIFTGEPLVIGVPGTLSIIIVLLSTLVFLEVSIFMDAYFSPGKPMRKSWWIIMTLLGISFIIKFFLDNDFWYQLMNLAAGCFIVIVMLSILVKQLISRKAEKEVDDE